jgi:putative transposase
MPRANRYFVPGKLYHLTHRCHDREFLFRFARDRDAYRQALWSSLRQAQIWVLAYCVTCNHIHLLVRSETTDAVSRWMQQLEGEFAQAYNRRKRRSGAFWGDRFHCTMVEGGKYLWRCMVYIELNMVRAGVVKHPAEWPWCSYQEWAGVRRRYRVIQPAECLSLCGAANAEAFRSQYERLIEDRLARDMVREPEWTESIAVGSRAFVEEIAPTILSRQQLERVPCGADAWVLRET